jgi:hypothetical protein
MIIAINPRNHRQDLSERSLRFRKRGIIDTLRYDLRRLHLSIRGDPKDPSFENWTEETVSFICSDLKDISRYAYVSNYAYK